MIIIGILIGITIGIIILIALLFMNTNESRDTSVKKESTKPEEKDKNTIQHEKIDLSWIKNVVYVLLFVFLIIINPFKSCGKDDDPEKAKTESGSSNNNIYDYIEVNYSEEYSTVYVASGLRIAFIEATEPYCVKNRNEVEACGEKGQDVSSDLPRGSANTVLNFKSTSGKTGHLRIRTRPK